MSKQEITKLEEYHRSLRDKHQADRVKAVIALANGFSAAQVAKILLFDERTSRNYFERYQQGGVAALLEDHYPGAEPKLQEHQLRTLNEYLQEHILPDAKAVIAHIERQYGVHYTLGGVTDLLHRLDFSYKKPTHVPGKQDPVRQQAFLKDYDRLKARKGENDPIYFADATHPQHNSIPSYGWIKKGQEKELKANCGRQRLNINGAINIETLESTVRFYETINAQSAMDLFARIEAQHPLAKKIYIIVDKAGMLWWEEVPVYWLPNVHKEPQLSMALGMMRETIVRDWNRASLIFWSVSNECAGGGADGNMRLLNSLEDGNYPYWKKACQQVRSLDPSRLISSADSGHRRTLNSNWSPDAGDAFDADVHNQDFLPGHPDEFYELLDVLGANLYVQRLGDNPVATDKFVDMLRDYNKPLMITEFGSMSTTEYSKMSHSPEDLGNPQRHATILREGYEPFHCHPEIVGYVPWVLMDVRVPMHWRCYNRGTATFAYGLCDNNYTNKAVFKVVQQEIAKLKKYYGDK